MVLFMLNMYWFFCSRWLWIWMKILFLFCWIFLMFWVYYGFWLMRKVSCVMKILIFLSWCSSNLVKIFILRFLIFSLCRLIWVLWEWSVLMLRIRYYCVIWLCFFLMLWWWWLEMLMMFFFGLMCLCLIMFVCLCRYLFRILWVIIVRRWCVKFIRFLVWLIFLVIWLGCLIIFFWVWLIFFMNCIRVLFYLISLRSLGWVLWRVLFFLLRRWCLVLVIVFWSL